MKRMPVIVVVVMLLGCLPVLRAQTSLSDFIRIDMRDGLPESRVRNLRQTPDGELIVATAGTISLYDGTRFAVFNLAPEYRHTLTGYRGKRHLSCDSTGIVWLRNDNSLYVLDARRRVLVSNLDSLMAGRGLTVEQISRWPAESDWQANPQYERVKSLVDDEITSLLSDCYGGLWTGLKDGGLLYYNPARRRQFMSTDTIFGYDRQYPFCSSHASELSARFAPAATNCTLDERDLDYTFLGTRSGIMIIDRQERLVGVIDKDYGLSTNNITSLIKDKRGDVWAATADGLTRLHQTGRDSFAIVNYGPLDGVDTRGREFATCATHCEPSGLVTVGFAGGTCRFNPDSVNALRYTFYFPRLQPDLSEASAVRSFSQWWWQWLIVIFVAVASAWAAVRVARRRWRRGEENKKKAEIDGMATDVARNIAEENKLPSADELFLDKLNRIIGQHLANEDFSVQTLSEMMAMDRTVLYRRMLALTGVSPSVYIKGIRMRTAQKLLVDTDMSLNDIAFKTGFSTTKYFSASFKENFGSTPSDYREKHKNTISD